MLIFNVEKFWKSYVFNDLMIFVLLVVFSLVELDGGIKLLFFIFYKVDGLKGKVLDLGCGVGVIGVSLKK